MKPRDDEITAELIPEVPLNVAMNDLDSDFYLVNKQTRDKINADPRLALLSDGRIKKKELQAYLNENLQPGEPNCQLHFDVLKINGDYYALYRGIKHNTQKGAGGSGVGKSAQNLRTGEWIVPKVVSEFHREHNSVRNLTQRSQLWFESEKRLSRKEVEMNKKMGISVGDKPLPERGASSKGRQFTIPLVDAGIDLYLYFHKLNTNNVILHPAHMINIFVQMAEALTKLQTVHGMMHRDFKRENVLINPHTGKITVIDFASSTGVPANNEIIRDHVLGTPYTRAPESVYGEYSAKTDSFSLGATIAAIMDMIDTTGPVSKLQPKADVLLRNPFKYDQEFLQDVYAIAENLMQDKSVNRSSLSDALAELVQLQKNMIQPVRMGWINLADYSKISDPAVRIQIIENARRDYNEVVIINTDKKSSMQEAIILRRALLEAGLRVNPQLYTGEEEAVKQRVKTDYFTAQPEILHAFPANQQRLSQALQAFNATVQFLCDHHRLDQSIGDQLQNSSVPALHNLQACGDFIDHVSKQLRTALQQVKDDPAGANNAVWVGICLAKAVSELVREMGILAEEDKINIGLECGRVKHKIEKVVGAERANVAAPLMSSATVSPLEKAIAAFRSTVVMLVANTPLESKIGEQMRETAAKSFRDPSTAELLIDLVYDNIDELAKAYHQAEAVELLDALSTLIRVHPGIDQHKKLLVLENNEDLKKTIKGEAIVPPPLTPPPPGAATLAPPVGPGGANTSISAVRIFGLQADKPLSKEPLSEPSPTPSKTSRKR